MRFPILVIFSLLFFVEMRAEYVRPTGFDEAVWNELAPYFLPEEHPLKERMDRVFTQFRVTLTADTLRLADFKGVRKGKPFHATVVKHPKLKGYVLKLFTDDDPMNEEWNDWKRRIIGAQAIEAAIDRLGYQDLFKVPKKWIYPLPVDPEPLPGFNRKFFVLVAEDMKILPREKNFFWWKSVAMTQERVCAIYTMLQEVGLIDSVYIDNLPFAKDRKMAFVDTQHHHLWPIPFGKLNDYFAHDMRYYWEQLTGQRPN